VEETQEAVIDVRDDENVTCDCDGHKTPTTLKNGDVADSASRRKAVAGSGSKVIVSHSPEGSIAARVVSSPMGSMSRLSSLGSGCSYSLSPDGSSMSCPASNGTGLRHVSSVTHLHILMHKHLPNENFPGEYDLFQYFEIDIVGWASVRKSIRPVNTEQ